MTMSHGPSLKRSQKTDFFENATITRERSFVRPNKELPKRRTQIFAPVRGKPTLEIYRPPNVRIDPGKLNVHAKEFIMNHELQLSKSSGNINQHLENVPLMHSKSSGNILRHFNPTFIPIMSPTLPLPLLHSTSSSHILNHVSNVGFHQYPNEVLSHQLYEPKQTMPQSTYQQNKTTYNLKRSKSLGASDVQTVKAKLKTVAKEEIDLQLFPPENQAHIKLALEDPNQLSSRMMMDLVKLIMERVVEGLRFCETGAKLCLLIIENEKNNTFLESLLNMCQQWYQERDKILRGIKAGDGTRFTAFMWFLTEMCGQLKRHQIKEQFDSLQPDIILLSLLAKCCEACVSLPIKCVSETECLFFVLTSIGRDLESELPQQLELLLANVRDGFLASAGSAAVRRTLLQLIELHASNWQLPGSSVLYYYPRIK